jgi:hypothetical protein
MLDLPSDGTVSWARIAEMLAPTLGWEKSTEVVGEAAARLELPSEAMTLAQAIQLLGELGRAAGMVGIAARFARSRLDGPRPPPPVSVIRPSTPPPSSRSRETRAVTIAESPRLPTFDAPPSSRKPPETTVTAHEIASLLAVALGAEKALELVLGAARRLGIAPERIDKQHAMALLDQLAGEPGVIGLCARFTKARLILRFAA